MRYSVPLPGDPDLDALGRSLHDQIAGLYPICRSITGDGVRETLAAVGEQIPLQVREVPSGTPVFDWTVPDEWNIRDAWIKNARGERVVDFGRCNLHVLNYSTPIRARLPLEELRKHLFTLPDQPDLIPYRSSYYARNWGFCLSQRQLDALEDGEYEVCIDASLEPGHLTYGECLLPGETTDEVLISCHVCHPSLANDNLSGITIAAALARHLEQQPRRYSYRFLFIPGTIGAITWLALNQEQAARVKHGLVLVCLGDPGSSTYKQSRRGDAEIDQAVEHVLAHSGAPYTVQEFFPYGYDERQYCSPGFNLPVGCFMRTPHGQFPEYHTSADNLDLVRPESLADSFAKCLAAVTVLEQNRRYRSLNPFCEPQLGKRGLYSAIGGEMDAKSYQMALLWVLNLSDGDHTLLDIARRSGMAFGIVRAAADALLKADLLAEAA
jgi:aminopeptidase-like protein